MGIEHHTAFKILSTGCTGVCILRRHGRCSMAMVNPEHIGAFSSANTGVLLIRRYDRCAMEAGSRKPIAMFLDGNFGGVFAEDT